MKGVVERSFRLNLTIMKCIGFYPLEQYPNFYKFYSYIVFTIVLLPASLLGFIQLLIKEHTSEGFDFISSSLVFLGPKLFSVVINGDNIKKCIVYFDKEIFASQSQNHMDIVNTCVRICRRNSYIFLLAVVVGIFSWCGKLVVIGHGQLPLDVWLPFANVPILYDCLYFDLIFGAFYAGFACATIDPLIAGLICHASGQLQILKENLKHLKYNTIVKPQMIYGKISECIEHYNAITNFVEEYERSFSSAIFCQFAHSMVTLCICCLEISKLQNFNLYFLIMANYFVFLLIQVYFYCYYGTMLIEENNTLSDAVYMTNWYEYSQQSKKTLMILMECSKRPLVITAGKILDLSLETFSLILRRSYSLLAVLKNY